MSGFTEKIYCTFDDNLLKVNPCWIFFGIFQIMSDVLPVSIRMHGARVPNNVFQVKMKWWRRPSWILGHHPPTKGTLSWNPCQIMNLMPGHIPGMLGLFFVVFITSQLGLDDLDVGPTKIGLQLKKTGFSHLNGWYWVNSPSAASFFSDAHPSISPMRNPSLHEGVWRGDYMIHLNTWSPGCSTHEGLCSVVIFVYARLIMFFSRHMWLAIPREFSVILMISFHFDSSTVDKS